MAVFGIALVRDEADIIEHTVSHMLREVDHVMVLDNRSVDGTREILEGLGVEVIDDDNPAHYQSRKISWLACQAAARGAEWVVPFDADEAWISPHGRIADVLAPLSDAIAPALIFNHRPTGADPDDPDPMTRMGWRSRDPLRLHKVACRTVLPVTIGEGNHVAHYPTPSLVHDLLVVHHYPYRSDAQFVSKVRNGAAALAAAPDLPEGTGAHWRQYGRHLDENGPEALVADVFRPHFYTEDPSTDPTLIFDPCPGW